VSIVDRAQVPAFPVLPKVRMNLAAGLFGGIFLGLLLAFVVEALDDTLNTSEELEAVAGLPVLCSVPVSAKYERNRKELGKVEKVVHLAPIVLEMPQSHAAEAFRALRSALLLSSSKQLPRVISIVSALAGEGKTTVSVNLGITFAQRGESVLLVDADLRRSMMHSQFGLTPATIGTSTLLTQGFDEKAILTPIESLPGLKLLPAGPHPPNPSELLGSKRMVELIEQLSGQFDRIIIDNPPVISVADSLALANLSDATVLVVRSGISRRRAVLRARDLPAAPAAILSG
jgi:capsular exopolysaccharide synthesis family protein